MTDAEDSPFSPPDSEAVQAKAGLSPRLFFIALCLLTGMISYALTFVWPGEDRSLSYLPRFLPSMAVAAVILKLLGLWQTHPAVPNDASSSENATS